MGWDVVVDGKGREQPSIIFPIPRGQVYLRNLTDRASPLSVDICVTRFLRPMVKMISIYNNLSLTHRAISPMNLFVDYSGRHPDFIMGQCVSDPAGTVQPLLIENITCGLADSKGRGSETIANDIYALAAMTVILLHGRIPMSDKSDDHIIRKKLRVGSYAAIVEGCPLPPPMVEPIRGMLNDDPNERWSLKDIESWAQGRQVNPKQYFIFVKGKVPFHMERNVCHSRHDLAYELGINWEEGLEYTGKIELSNWVKRSLNDEEGGKTLQNLQTQSGGIHASPSGNNHSNLARIISVLDPLGPLRMEGLSFTPTGLGLMTLHHLNDRKNTNILKNTIYQELLKFWYRYHIYHHATYTSVIHEINLALHAISQERSEYGVERILYNLNEDLPCLSKFFNNYHVFGLEYFMDVIEKELAAKSGNFNFHIDRHMIAYIAVHHRHVAPNLLRQATDIYDRPRYVMAQVNVLSILQKEYGKKPYPAICHAICTMLDIVVKQFKNLKLQERTYKRLANQCDFGDIAALLSIIDDTKIRRQDGHAYKQARNEYHDNSVALNDLAAQREHLYHDSHDKARDLSVTTCAITAGLGLLAFLI